MNQNEEIRVLYVQPGKYPEEIKIPNTLETFQKYVCGSIESVSISLTELPLLFEKLKDGGTLGQSVPKSEEEKEEN